MPGSARASGSSTPSVRPAPPGRHASQQRSVSGDERPPRREQVCFACGRSISGQFVRALGVVYHLDCFCCADCGRNVASKFFSSTEDMAAETQGQLFPLCETDYFRRLDLLCVKCGRALRGSYITALGAKYHLDHFSCSICDTLFGPDDSYYEHDGRVYCHFHYSTMFAIQCTGCQTAILKQFVEINRNNADEHWHPECYMIHRYWKIKLAPGAPAAALDGGGGLPALTLESADESTVAMPGGLALSPSASDELVQAPAPPLAPPSETPASVLQKQHAMERRVSAIWNVLSAYEESSAACISDMLRHVSSGKYVGGMRCAARFIVHVEVLFAAIDELNRHFTRLGASPISHGREARMLCKKIVHFFSLLSHAQEAGAKRMHVSQELLALVTGLAHYLKILIRVSLTAALRLDQAFEQVAPLESFLARLEKLVAQSHPRTLDGGDAPAAAVDVDTVHGYTSLPLLLGTHELGPASDLCVACGRTVEDQCVRVGLSLRWHYGCLHCAHCHRGTTRPDGSRSPVRRSSGDGAAAGEALAPVPLAQFAVRHAQRREKVRPYCQHCLSTDGTRLAEVTRLEQYAFLLCVALSRLDVLLTRPGLPQIYTTPAPETASSAAPAAPAAAHPALLEPPSPQARRSDSESSELTDAESSTYRKSSEAKRLASQFLDRHMSSKAHVPRIATVVGEPSAQASPAQDRAAGASPTLPAAESVVVWEPPPAAESHASDAMSITHDEALTLADIPMLLHAEQERERERGPGEAARRPVSTLSANDWLVLKSMALARLQASRVGDAVDVDELLELTARKSTFWGKLLFKSAKDRRDTRRRGVFGVPLDDLVERHGAESMLGATPTPLRVPAILDDMISALRQMDVSVEGIFRKNGNVRRLKALADALDRGDTSVNLLDENPVQLAALLKRFLRELPDPLIPERLHPLLSRIDVGDDERRRLLRYALLLLPRSHRDTMEVLFTFLRWVATFSHVDEEAGSKMDLANLATVMAPNVLQSRAADASHVEAQRAQRLLADLLEHQDDLWMVPDDLRAALSDRALVAAAPELAPAELLKRCAAYL